MDRLPERSTPFPVYHPYLEYPPLFAFGEVMGHEIPDFFRLKGMKVEDSVDRDFCGFLSHETIPGKGVAAQRRIRLSAMFVPMPFPYPSCIMSIAIGSR
jgi:hypothetical protein